MILNLKKNYYYILFIRFINFINKIFPKFFSKSNKYCIYLCEKINLQYKANTPFGNLLLSTPNNLTLWRAETLLTKEPDTIEWIKGFKKDNIIYDIGANVGLYTLCAAIHGSNVYAFEPEAQNYALLNRNLFLNNLDKSVKAFNIAVSNSTRFDTLYIKEMTIGGALNNFGDNLNYNKKRFKESFKQGIMSVSIDDLIEKFSFPVPDHIKIDVDGIEPDIIDGAKKTLANLKVKSVLIELNTALERDIEVINFLESISFKCKSKLQPAACVGTEFENIFNFIFVRDE